jgi:hypothetical protein
MVMRGRRDGDTLGWTRGPRPPTIAGSGANRRLHVTTGWKVDETVVRVLLIGEHAAALAPVRAALGRMPRVQVVPGADPANRAGPAVRVDLVMLEQTLGTARTAERLVDLVGAQPGTALVSIALREGTDYRWLRVRRATGGFLVEGAGTGHLEDVLRDSLETPQVHPAALHQPASPAMPCSTA